MTTHVCKQEHRIRALEMDNVGLNKDIKELVKKMDSLMSILKVIAITLLPTMFGVLGYLISYWVKG